MIPIIFKWMKDLKGKYPLREKNPKNIKKKSTEEFCKMLQNWNNKRQRHP